MGVIIYDARRIKAYERLKDIGVNVGVSEEELDALWKEMVLDGDMMKEFVYFLDNHTLLDEIKCEGYGMTDLYMWLLARHNLLQDYGKNGAGCNKDRLVLETFSMMTQMRKNPAPFIKMLEDDFGLGMDQGL